MCVCVCVCVTSTHTGRMPCVYACVHIKYSTATRLGLSCAEQMPRPRSNHVLPMRAYGDTQQSQGRDCSQKMQKAMAGQHAPRPQAVCVSVYVCRVKKGSLAAHSYPAPNVCARQQRQNMPPYGMELKVIQRHSRHSPNTLCTGFHQGQCLCVHVCACVCTLCRNAVWPLIVTPHRMYACANNARICHHMAWSSR